MAELSKGHAYSPGDVVDAADLNALVDAASALKGIILDQPSAAPVAADDSVLFYDLSATDLARCKISALPSGVTSVAMTAAPTSVFGVSVATPSTTPAIALTLDNQAANKVLAGPSSGVAAEPAFRVLTPADLPSTTVVAILALAIDWSLGGIFTKTLPVGAGNTAFLFSNDAEGQTIKVRLIQNATGNRTVSWPSVVWRGTGPAPAMTPLNNARDIFTFTRISGLIYGYADQNFTL